jgi:hypothetical protein
MMIKNKTKILLLNAALLENIKLIKNNLKNQQFSYFEKL